MSRIVRIHTYGDTDVMVLEEVPDTRLNRTFPLDQVHEAHRYLESGTHMGKVVITVDNKERNVSLHGKNVVIIL